MPYKMDNVSKYSNEFYNT